MARDASGAALSTTRVLANDALLQRRDGWDWDGDPAAGGGQQLEDLWEVPAARPPVAPRGHELEASTRHGGRSGGTALGHTYPRAYQCTVTQSATFEPMLDPLRGRHTSGDADDLTRNPESTWSGCDARLSYRRQGSIDAR